MVHNCAIISCPLHNRRNIRKGLLFHSFPVDQHRFELWRQTVFNHCSQTLSINKHSKICYRHFHPDDYIANHTGLTRYLKATAIPSIFTEIHSNTTAFSSVILRNHQLTSTNLLLETQSSSFIPLSKSSPATMFASTTTDTKTKRLLNTIDKLHQIQNASKISLTEKLTLENESAKQDEKSSNDAEQVPDKMTQMNDAHSVEASQSVTIEHENLTKEQATIQDTCQHPSLESETFRWPESTNTPLPKSHLEDALLNFLEQANLLQYYSAFIEQGGDDLKQLADAQNDDFQEIITLVGMASKPLHVKRFKKALIEYRQSMSNTEIDLPLTNHSYPTVSLRRLPIAETLADRTSLPLLLPSTSTNNHSPKNLHQLPSSWCLNKIDLSKNTSTITNNSHQLLDDNQRKMIADEAERLANLLPTTTVKKPNGRNTISKDLFATIHLPRDFEDRWQRIRKYSAIYNRFDSKKPNQVMSLHEIFINEAAAAICFHRTGFPKHFRKQMSTFLNSEFLTRRDELLHLARRVLQNIGISTSNTQKRPMNMLTCDITPAKQVRLNMSVLKPVVRQRDPDTFRLMWHNRETKVEQIPIEIEALRSEQNSLLQQLKQNTIEPSSSIDNNGLRKQIDDLGKKIEQLTDEEKTLRRLIRKKNMRLRAKERQQQKQQVSNNQTSTIQDLMLPILPIASSALSLPLEVCQERSRATRIHNDDMCHSLNIKDEKVEPAVNLSSPVLKARKEFSSTTLMAKPIDRRRNEVNERSMRCEKTVIASTIRSACWTDRMKSSSTTTMELGCTANLHSRTSTSIYPVMHNEQDVVESKSFIHNLHFTSNTPIETNE